MEVNVTLRRAALLFFKKISAIFGVPTGVLVLGVAWKHGREPDNLVMREK